MKLSVTRQDAFGVRMGAVELNLDFDTRTCLVVADGLAPLGREIALSEEGSETLFSFLAYNDLRDVSHMPNLPRGPEIRGVVETDDAVLDGVVYDAEIEDGDMIKSVRLITPEYSDSRRVVRVGRFFDFLLQKPTRKWRKRLRTGAWMSDATI